MCKIALFNELIADVRGRVILFFNSCLEHDNISHVFQKVHLLFQIVIHDNNSLRLATHIKPTSGKKADRNPIF
jgi:hypothetical protein